MAYAAAGIPVFPCVVNDKNPATANGFHDATTNVDQINRWWQQADYNLAICPEDAGWAVVDIDVGEGKEGAATWAVLEAEHGASTTRVIRTPRGGQHLYFAGSLPASQGDLKKGLGPGVDTRGVGSYVLVPPSIVNGKAYEVQHDRAIGELPDWIAARVHRQSAPDVTPVAHFDAGAVTARARDLLTHLVRNGDVAIEGRGGDTRTFNLACELLDLGCSPEQARALLEEIWNPHCQPPWSHEELCVKIENASSYKQNEDGIWAVAPAAETFKGPALDTALAESTQRERDLRSRFHMEDEDEQEQGADPSWLVKELLPESSTVLLVGPSGSYKSFIALELALSISTGTTTFGSSPLHVGPTFYAAAEGRANIKKARRRAWKAARGVDVTPAFYVGAAPMLALPEEVQQFGDEIKRRCEGRVPRLIVLDTVAKIMAGLNENDAQDAGRFIRFCDSLLEAFPGVTVIAVHHTGKDETRGARGSSAFLAGFDTVLEVKAHKPTKAVEVWVKKHKDAEERSEPFTFEGKAVGQSLVFQPTTREEHAALVGKDESMDKRAVGEALKGLKAVGADNAVTTMVLASAVAPASSDAAERDKLIRKTARTLSGLARSKLEPYAEVIGKDLMWSLPVAPA